MNKALTDRLFCFSENEFAVLADACGLHTIYGFDMKGIDSDESNESRYNRSIVTLCMKNVLVPQKDGFLIVDEVENIFECIGSARYILKLIYCDNERAPVCIYPGEGGIVYMQPATNGVDYINIGIKRDEPLERFLEESDYLPMAETPAGIISLRKKSHDVVSIPEEVFERIPGIIFYGTLEENVSRRILKRVAVVQTGIEEILVSDTPDSNREAEFYTRDRFIDSICVGMEV